MKIQKVTIKNFKGIKDLSKVTKGKNVYLTGGNGVGKSSFIEAIWFGLTGKNMPPAPTTNNAKKGLIEVDLGDFIARTKITKGKPTVFELENKHFEGEADKFIKAPRTYLNKRIGVIDFDIADFFSKTDLEKLKYFSKVLDTDFSSLDADIQEIEESRKFDKKRLAEVEGKQSYYDEELAEKELIDIAQLSKDIAERKAQIDEHERVSTKLAEKKEEFKELEKQLAQLRDSITQGEKWVEENKPDTKKYEELKAQLETANQDNEKISEAKEGKQIDEKVEMLKNAIDKANKDIAEVREQKAILISESIKVPGLSYNVDEETFKYNGLPFDDMQQNTADQLIAGMHIASTLFKELRILKVDASLIDKENFAKVKQWAEEKDIELFVELVDREGTQLNIHVED